MRGVPSAAVTNVCRDLSSFANVTTGSISVFSNPWELTMFSAKNFSKFCVELNCTKSLNAKDETSTLSSFIRLLAIGCFIIWIWSFWIRSSYSSRSVVLSASPCLASVWFIINRATRPLPSENGWIIPIRLCVVAASLATFWRFRTGSCSWEIFTSSLACQETRSETTFEIRSGAVGIKPSIPRLETGR